MTPHTALVGLEVVAAVGTVGALTVLVAPYGRHARSGWGPPLSGRAAWLLMESPAVFGFTAVYFAGDHATDAVPLGLLAIWLMHYVHRGVVYPLRMRTAAPMPVVVVAAGFVFNVLNAWINARWISHLARYPPGWWLDPRFVVGVLVFVVGWVINRDSDERLRRLRTGDDRGYHVPSGGLYRWVSCPNYLGELLEWAGWALATWSWAGFAFFVYTAANLVPRAASHHRWYRATFPDYPQERRALVPGVW